ncbi:MAG: hypothetical protein Q8K86_01395 [Candidatus Nanopelagicaceae bacterium]|nr:hypothetical protein [Candidatus Nanopelagicaceae bacterium]
MTEEDDLDILYGRAYIPRWAYTDALHLAIGRVAAESALLDEALTELVDELSGTMAWWRITEGQNTIWLLETCKILLEDTNAWYKKYSKVHHDAFMALLKRADGLRILRNQIIHGVWTTEHYLDADDHPLPDVEIDLDGVYIVGRARIRADYLEQYMSINDVNLLSKDLAKVRDDLVRMYRKMTNREDSEYLPMPRWARNDNDGRNASGQMKQNLKQSE